jgi:type IV secretion system protein VirD4
VVKDAQNIADMLIDLAGNVPRDHWDLTAHDLLTGVILHVIHAESDKTHLCLAIAELTGD